MEEIWYKILLIYAVLSSKDKIFEAKHDEY